jgi:hypothetical protein
LHIAHVPPPPQADGRNIFSFARVDSNELPAETVNVFSPLMRIFTGPDCTNFFCAKSNISTNNKMITVNATMEDIMIILKNFNAYKYIEEALQTAQKR